MMGAAVRKPLLWALLLLSFFLWRLGVGYAAQLGHYEPHVTLRLGDPLAASDYDAIALLEWREATPLPFALWTELADESVRSVELNRRSTCSVLAVRGDSGLVLPFPQTVADTDTAGCLVDTETAVVLFGTERPLGGRVEYDDAIYEIRGVVDMPAPTLLLQLTPDSEIRLDTLSLTADDTRRDAFLWRHGLSAAWTLRGVSFVRFAALFAGLPVAVAAILALALLAGLHRDWRGYPLRRACTALLLFVSVTAAILALIDRIPVEYIPSKWSDFSFWGDLLADLRRGWFAYFVAVKHRPDLLMLAAALKSLWGLAAAALLLLWYRMLPRRPGRHSPQSE